MGITQEGNPQLQDTGEGKAVVFDGVHDRLLVPTNPLEGSQVFTIEVLFMPCSGGATEQRFVHLAEDGGEMNRILLETRIHQNEWFLDTFLQSGSDLLVLNEPRMTHATDHWYWVAMSYDGKMMRHFVNGEEEAAGPVAFAPLGTGKTSLGVRMNKVSWFKGAIKELLFHRYAVSAPELKRV